MATDFAPYANVRLLWTRPEPIEDLRSGIPIAGTDLVIEAFLRVTTPSPEKLPQITAGKSLLSGYLTAWAELPAQTSWLAAGSTFSWNSSGLMPDGLRQGDKGRAFIGRLESLPTIDAGGVEGRFTIQGLAAPFGIGGIGTELRAALGDKLEVMFEMVQ